MKQAPRKKRKQKKKHKKILEFLSKISINVLNGSITLDALILAYDETKNLATKIGELIEERKKTSQ